MNDNKFKKEKYNSVQIVQPADYSKFKTLIFMDLEYITTKFKKNGHREYLQEIVEIALIIKKQNQDIYTYSTIVNPRYYMQYLKTNYIFNKISFEELLNGVDLSKVVYEINKFYEPESTLIIAWGGSDLYTINSLCKKYNIDYSLRKDTYIDLSIKFKNFYKMNQILSLEKSLCYVGINEKYNKHRALPDTEMLFKIFNKMLIDGYKENIFFSK